MKREEMSNSVQGCILDVSHKFLQKNFEKAAKLEVHPGQMPIFRFLNEHEGASQRELADMLRIKPPTVNVSIQRMEKSGFVYKKTDEKDQRITRIYLTEKGKQIDKELGKLMEENEKIITRGFSESELCLVKRMLRQMMENLENA